jgi:hypothetical protein
MRERRFELLNLVGDGDRLAIEFLWSGTLAVPVGSLQPGDEMRGRFASFIELRRGKIAAQRSYDCFEPW